MEQHRSILAILYHLYKKPLYSAVSESQTELRVLVVGFGAHGRTFLDACLQAGQIRRKRLQVVVVAESAEAREEYLNARPFLKDFFNVDGSLASVGRDVVFGELRFLIKSPSWSQERPEGFQEIVRTVAPHYAFIAVGVDGVNLELARSVKSVLDEQLKTCVINYARENPSFLPSGETTDAALSVAVDQVLPATDAFKIEFFQAPERVGVDVEISARALVSERASVEPSTNVAFETDRLDAALSVELSDDSALRNAGGLATMKIEPALEENPDLRALSVSPEEEIPEITFPEANLPPLDFETVLIPVYVNMDVEQTERFDEFERMALNTRLATCKTFYEDRDKLMKDFRTPSVYYSCLSSVLALKYKLHSVGIELEKKGYDGAAKLFARHICDVASPVLEELVYVEHRRWATEKLCLGFRPKSIEECLEDGKLEDERSHAALVRCRPELKLEKKAWKNVWNALYVDYWEFDDLDSVAVRLHRELVEKAKERLNEFAESGAPNVFSDRNLSDVRAILEGSRGVKGKRRARLVFQEWFACVRNAWHGEIDDVSRYERLKRSFLEEARVMSASKKEKLQLRKSVQEFDRRFYPIVARFERRNWKREYLTLAKNIPFILTYSAKKTCLVVPFKTGDPSELFENLGAITFVAPEKAVYLFILEKSEDREELIKALGRISKYLENKQIQTQIELILLLDSHLFCPDDNMCNELRNHIHKSAGGRIRTSFLKTSCSDAGLEPLLERLSSLAKDYPYFAIGKNDSLTSTYLRATGVGARFPHFAFDSPNMEFYALSRCDWLGYVKKSPSLTLSDVLALSTSRRANVTSPEFSGDYERLWKIYSSFPSAWKRFCNILNGFMDSVSVHFHAPSNDICRLTSASYVYTLRAKEPWQFDNLVGNCRKIAHYLSKRGIIDAESSVDVSESTLSVKVKIFDPYRLREPFDKLFKSYGQKLMNDANIATFRRVAKTGGVKVVLGELKVENLPVESPSVSAGDRGAIYRMASIFGNAAALCCNVHWGYSLSSPLLRDIKKNQDGTLSFFFVSRPAKELLTIAGKILEIYTYYKLKETGFFDAVVPSCEIYWDESEVRNEFDCILTKGFRTFFIECKTRSLLEQSIYYKCDYLKRRFGINGTAILVADTREENNPSVVSRNKALRKRGESMNITTVHSVNEINNIGGKIASLCGTKPKRRDSF